MLLRWLCALVSIAFVGAEAYAAPLWGTRSEAGLGDMYANTGQNNFSFVTDGPEDPNLGPQGGDPATHSLLDDATMLDGRGTGPWSRGVGEASAALNFSGATQPASLRARAILTGNVSNNVFNGQPAVDAAITTLAFASDMFRYTGVSATTQSITFTLTGTLDNSPTDPSGQTGVFVFVDAFAEANYWFTTDRGALRFETPPGAPAGTPAPVLKAGQSISVTSGTTFNRTATLTFNVAPGEVIFVRQSLAAWAAGDDRFADAYSTLSSAFDHPELFQSLAVPEPAEALLLVVGALALAQRRKLA